MIASPLAPRLLMSFEEFTKLRRTLPIYESLPSRDCRDLRAMLRSNFDSRWWLRIADPMPHYLLADYGETLRMGDAEYLRLHLHRVVVRMPAATRKAAP